MLRSHGVTHVGWQRRGGIGRPSIAAEVAFHYFVNNHLAGVRKLAGYHVGALPEEAPSDQRFTGKVAVLDCARQYDPGIYDVRDLTQTRFRGERNKKSEAVPIAALEPPLSKEATIEAFAEVDAVWSEPKCVKLSANPSKHGFVKAHERKGVIQYVRKAKTPEDRP